MYAWIGAGVPGLVMALAFGLGPGINRLPMEIPPVVGVEERVPVSAEDTLLDVAVDHGVGFEALARLNPEIDVWMPSDGDVVTLPTWMIFPHAPAEGLVINLPEMRLYDFTGPGEPRILPIAIGDPTAPSPVGDRRVQSKAVDPVWVVPESIRAEDPGLPAKVPPGPDNPLGRYWLAIGDGFGIHGTNNFWSIGRIATHGCIRLHNRDVEALFERIPVGTPVHLVYQTVKLGQRDGRLFLEAHPDVYGLVPQPTAQTLVHLLVLGLLGDVDREAVERTIAEARGVPMPIGTLPGPPPAQSERR